MALPKIQNAITIFLGAAVSCLMAFVNRFPLVFTDTGTYIRSGFSGFVPPDRPIFYGLFLRHVSLASSLWLVIFVQGLILSWVIFITLRMFFRGKQLIALFAFSMVFLSCFTSYSYTVSTLIPDCFSTIAFLSLVNLMLNTELSKLQRALLTAVLILSICAHFSNLPVLMLLLFMVGLYPLFFEKSALSQIRRIGFVAVAIISSLLIIPTVNLIYSGQFFVSKGGHAFIMNHFLECGILDVYLEDNCADKPFQICEYKDVLSDVSFLWHENSPMQKMGGWNATQTEFNAIISDIITTPKYWPMLIQTSLEHTAKQLLVFRTSLDGPQLRGSPVWAQIHWHYRHALHSYEHSKQNLGLISLTVVNVIHHVVVVMSLLTIALILGLTRGKNPLKLNRNLYWLLGLTMLFVISSAAVCSNMSTVHPRYLSRIIWLLPLLAIVTLAKWWQHRQLRA